MLTSRIQNKYLSLGWLVFALAVLGCVQLSAETPFEELKTKLDLALEENSREVGTDQKIETLGKMYLDRLADLRVGFVVQGSLDGVLEVQDEIRRFEKSGDSSPEFSSLEQLAHYQRIYANEIEKIQSEEMVGALKFYNVYENGLLKREEELVRIGFIDKAVEVREERNRVTKLIKKMSRGRVDPKSVRPEDVFARPGEGGTAVSAGDNQETVRGEAKFSNEAFDALKVEFNQALAAHWELVASEEQKLYQEYMKELQVRKFHYQSAGSLDGVLALRAAMKLLEDKGTLSRGETELKHLAIVQRNFARDLQELKSTERERLLAIYRQYLDDLGELERSLVKKQLIDLAILVRKERERVAEISKNWSRKDLVLSVFEVSQGE